MSGFGEGLVAIAWLKRHFKIQFEHRDWDKSDYNSKCGLDQSGSDRICVSENLDLIVFVALRDAKDTSKSDINVQSDTSVLFTFQN